MLVWWIEGDKIAIADYDSGIFSDVDEGKELLIRGIASIVYSIEDQDVDIDLPTELEIGVVYYTLMVLAETNGDWKESEAYMLRWERLLKKAKKYRSNHTISFEFRTRTV